MISLNSIRAGAYVWFVLALVVLMQVSCKKPKNNITGGGKGGNATLKVSAEHFGTILDTAIIYIKYATTDAPTNGIYDDSATCTLISDTAFAVFTDLTTGNYYLLAKAIHGGFSPPTVKGGKSWAISNANTIDEVVVPTAQYFP